jgi:hypothetical protein
VPGDRFNDVVWLTGFEYLSRPDAYRASDAAWFDSLRRVHVEKSDAVTLQDIEQSGVLPYNTLFYGVPLSTTALGRTTRREARDRWFENGLRDGHKVGLIVAPSARHADCARAPDELLADAGWNRKVSLL